MSDDKWHNYKPPFPNEPEQYKKLRFDQEKRRNELLTSPDRFQYISQREDRTEWPVDASRCLSKGKYFTFYRDFDICKSPVDLTLYHQLFSLVKPATVIELGTLSGGMAIWIADTMKILNIPCQIYSMDLDLSNLSEKVLELQPDNVKFMSGDCFNIEKCLTPEFLTRLPHPWVFIEDAHANMRKVLEYVHRFLKEGDYLVVEDTSPDQEIECGLESVYAKEFTTMGPQQLNCFKSFLQDYEEFYAVDSFLCDLFGYNGSWHWHGFIKKMK